MNLLAIDTSTHLATLALFANGRMHTACEAAQKQHAKRILPMVEALLVEAGVSFDAVDGLVFGRGPGSFTGLRIACSVAKGLAFARDLPLYPVSSLATMAFAARQKHGETPVLAAVDARMQQVYWAFYRDATSAAIEQVSAMSEIMLGTPEPFILAGHNLQDYRQQLAPELQQRLIAEEHSAPNAQSMIEMVQQGLIKPTGAAEASPVYVRNQVIQGASNG